MADNTIYLEENTEGIQPALPLPTPFCETPTVEIAQGESASEPSVALGFPTSFSQPTAGGNYITREQMNAMLNLATVNQCRAQHGGINTYNASLVSLTGGYEKGAVLDWWDDKTGVVCSVISLVDDNQVDFTAVGTDGHSVGPDGVNWRICSNRSSCFPSYAGETSAIIGKFSNLDLPSSYGWITGTIEMPFDGYVICNDTTTHATTSVQIPFAENFTWIFKVKTTGTINENTSGTTPIAFYSGEVDISLAKVTVVRPKIVSAKSFRTQHHEIFAAICGPDAGEPYVDMGNIGSGDTNCALCMVSSSGQDGGGSPGPILVKKGSKIRLFGRQGYSEPSGIEDIPDAYLSVTGTESAEVATESSLNTSLRIVAYAT